MAPTGGADAAPVHNYLTELQERICAAFEAEEPSARFSFQEFADDSGGLSRPRALADGQCVEKAAVNFTHSRGAKMPPAASERRPELAGRAFEAVAPWKDRWPPMLTEMGL